MSSKQWAALVLVLVVVVRLLGGDAYFPHDSVSENEQKWYGEALAAMSEPVLAPSDAGAGAFVFRVLILTSWAQPKAVRLQKVGDRIIRRSVRLSGRGEEPGPIEFDRISSLTAAEFALFRRDFFKSGLPLLPLKDDVMGFDGNQVVIEVIQYGRHWVFVRWTPTYRENERGLSELNTLVKALFREPVTATSAPAEATPATP